MLNQFHIRSTLQLPAKGGAHRAYVSILITLVLGLFGLGCVYVAIQREAIINTGEPVAVFLGLALLVLAWRRWEFGVQALLVIVIVEGALRKWFLPSYAEIVYFYKDALMGAILIGYLMKRRKMQLLIRQPLRLFLVVVGAFVLYDVAAIANPSAPHPWVSLFGVKSYCLYMPLAFIVPRMFTTKEKVVAFLRWYVVIALMVAALGAWQFIDGSQDSPLNRYAWSSEANQSIAQDTAMFVDSSGDYFIRITSTFSFISGLGTYLPVAFALLLALTSLRSARNLPTSVRVVYYLAIIAVVATAFMSGSRGVIVNLALVTVVFFALTSMENTIRRLKQIVVVGGLIVVAMVVVSPRAVNGVYQRALGGDQQLEEGSDRIEAVFTFPFQEAAYAGAFGYGIGTTQNGVPALIRTIGLTHIGKLVPIPAESESARVMLELGIVGFLLFMLMRVGILAVIWRACMSIRDRDCKALAVAALAALIFPLVAGGAVAIHTQNVYQWFLIGLIFALLNADRLSQSTLTGPKLDRPSREGRFPSAARS